MKTIELGSPIGPSLWLSQYREDEPYSRVIMAMYSKSGGPVRLGGSVIPDGVYLQLQRQVWRECVNGD
mgnify:CR=1 FL=1